MCLFAIPGSLLIAKLGPRRALVGGLGVVAAAGALRGVGPSLALLLGMTLVMGLGVALIQPAFPPLARLWFPTHVGMATAVYANGLLVGEVLPPLLTAALVLPLAMQSWQLALSAWSLPVLATLVWVLLATPHEARDAALPPALWWPDWRSRQTWSLGLIFGCASTLYWSGNAFIPDYLHATGRAQLVQAALLLLNLIQLPSSLIVGLYSRHLVGRRWPFVADGVLMVLAVGGFLFMPGPWALVWAAIFGFTSAGVLVLVLALPPILAPHDSHRLTAAILTITYAAAFLGPVLGGAIWDATGRPATAFVPGALGALALVVLAARLRLPTLARQPESSV